MTEVRFGQQVIQVQTGENTGLALSAATRAENAASSAEALTGPSFASIGAGIAGTASGDFFAVTSGGITTIYLNDGGVAVEQRTLNRFIQSGAGAVPRNQQDKSRERVSVKDFGAVGDGVTDDIAAFNAAVASGAEKIIIPSATYRLSAGWVVPGGVSVEGGGGLTSTTTAGTILLFDTSVPILVSLGDGGDAGNGLSASMSEVCVVRADGTVPAGSIGVNVQRLNNAKLTNIKSENSAIAYRLKAADSRGLGFKGVGMVSARSLDVDLEIDTWPEARFTLCRFGQNGVEEDSTAYVRIKGGSTINAAAGPNTIVFTNCQFNKGNSKKVDHIVRFEDFTPGYISDVGVFKFNACHIESFLGGVYTDNTVNPLRRLTFTDTHFNSVVEFWDLHPNTTVSSVGISNCFLSGDFTLAQTAQIAAMYFTGNRISGNASFTSGAGGNSSLISSGNIVVGNMTLAGPWQRLSIADSVLGTLTNTATGNWSVIVPGVTQRSWTPSLTFAGGSTGITYSSNRGGVISKIGDEVIAQFEFELTSKGSSTGNAFITGLPIAVRGGYNLSSSNGSGGTINFATNLTGLTGGVVMRTPSGATVDLYQWSPTGFTRVTDANITNTTRLAGTIRYRGA